MVNRVRGSGVKFTVSRWRCGFTLFGMGPLFVDPRSRAAVRRSATWPRPRSPRTSRRPAAPTSCRSSSRSPRLASLFIWPRGGPGLGTKIVGNPHFESSVLGCIEIICCNHILLSICQDLQHFFTCAPRRIKPLHFCFSVCVCRMNPLLLDS